MADTIPSINMNMPVPVVGVDPGPQWASDINSCLFLIDNHDHAPGSGVRITPAGINISSDLSFVNNDATNVRSVRFAIQGSPLSAPTDLGCIYESGVDLYYNDGNGNQVRLTQSGSIVGTTGSISGLVAPASASYVSLNSTFVFQSAVNTAANIDGANFLLRNSTLNSKALTLTPPIGMAADYQITLPALPASKALMQIDASGNITSGPSSLPAVKTLVQIDPTGTLTNAYNTLPGSVPSTLRVTSAGAVVPTAANYVVSASSGAFITASQSAVDVTNLTVTITTTGRPVVLALQSTGTAQSYLGTSSSTSGTTDYSEADIFIQRGGVNITSWVISTQGAAATFPPSAVALYLVPNLQYMDFPAAGTYTYKIRTNVDFAAPANTHNVAFRNCVLIAYEI